MYMYLNLSFYVSQNIKSHISFKNSRIFWRKAQVRSLETHTHKFTQFCVLCFFLCSATVASRRLLRKGSWKQTVSISLLLHQKLFSVFLQKFLTQQQNINCWAVTTEGIVNPLTSPSLSLTYLISFSLWKTWYGQCYQLSGFTPKINLTPDNGKNQSHCFISISFLVLPSALVYLLVYKH